MRPNRKPRGRTVVEQPSDPVKTEYEWALQEIRDVCRSGELLTQTKILEIYHAASKALGPQKTTLRDMRTGRKR